jgi:hypothetical protein
MESPAIASVRPPFLAAFIALSTFAAIPAVGADSVYFVERQISTTGAPTSGAMSKFEVTPPPGSGGRAGAQPQVKVASTVVNRLMRSDRSGGAAKVLLETDKDVIGISTAADGRVVCHLQGKASAGGQPQVAAQIVILSPNGSVQKTIDTAELGVKVIGTAVLLPDGKHIGLTICKALDQGSMQKELSNQQSPPPPTGQRMASPRPTGPHPTDPQSAQEQLSQLHGPTGPRTIGGGGGLFTDQPYVATIDLTGKNLKRIGPGAMPCWSPDGKTILFTAVTVSGMYATPTGVRLSTMNSDGSAVHTVAPDNTWDGSFNKDGKRIVYVSAAGQMTSQIITANADGSGATPAKLPNSIYASPRWLGDDKSIEFASRVEATGKSNAPSAQSAGTGAFKAVWVAGADGSGLKRVSPPPSDLNPHGSGIDQDAERFFFLQVGQPPASGPPMANTPTGPRGVAADPPMPGTGPTGTRPIPPGVTVESMGTLVFFRDSAGHRKMIPDGNYEMPDGTIMRVRGGKKMP